MDDERRSAGRARVSGVQVTYESATGDPVNAIGVDLSRGGLFVQTTKPLAVGKRIALEIRVVGEHDTQEPWAALGRVVWTREKDEDEQRPQGMGIRLIDADDAVLDEIDRLVQTRERTEPAVGDTADATPAVAAVAAALAREETLLGAGIATE